MLTISARSSAFSTTSRLRERSAEFTSKDGFSVVAPISTMSPLSTCASSASCCALLKRWISSMKTMVRWPRRLRRSSAAASTTRSSFTPESTALSPSKCALVWLRMTCARVVLPEPGGPHRISERSASPSINRRSGVFGAERLLLAHDLVERARPHAVGERGVGPHRRRA